MSIKIWTAYRIPKDRLGEFTSLVRKCTWESVLDRAVLLHKAITHTAAVQMLAEQDARVASYYNGQLPDHYKQVPLEKRLWDIRITMLEEKFRETHTSSVRSVRGVFDLEASFNVWFDDTYAYLIGYGCIEWPKSLPEWCEDYHYQNQVDRPEHITEEEYDARAAKWEELCLGDGPAAWDEGRFVHHIVNFHPLSYAPIYYIRHHLEQLYKEQNGENDQD